MGYGTEAYYSIFPGQTAFVFHRFTLQVVCVRIDAFGSSRCHQSLWLSDTHHFTSTSCKVWLSNHAIFSLNDVKVSCSAHLSILWSLMSIHERWGSHQVSAWCLSDGIPICQTFFSLNTYVILSYFSLILTSVWKDWLYSIFLMYPRYFCTDLKY